ncbi:MAG TPA: RIO1 family regulatory kinase/ATPase [Anaerolineales bacterium]|nr:RIO1 family regulatory kinase/ATPase [Anaerolineales bacterium]
MDTSKNIKYYNELDDEGRFDWPGKTSQRPAKKKSASATAASRDYIQEQDDSRRTFSYTYTAARFEEGWLLDSLGYFYEQHWISDVLRKIKGGKEASVYLCKAGEQVDTPLVAAKVYRPRMLRNLKNDQLYRLGRPVLDENGNPIVDLGMLKAQHKRSVYGEQIRHQSWIAYEFNTLQALHEAGVDVPRPYEMGNNAILMTYVGDERAAAPTLNSVRLPQDRIGPLFQRLVRNIELMLAHQVIHGDLSAYNVLYWEGDVVLIDFPQVVSPQHNRNAFPIFERDVLRLCEYFTQSGLRLDPGRLARDLWSAGGFPLRPEIPRAFLEAGGPDE